MTACLRSCCGWFFYVVSTTVVVILAIAAVIAIALTLGGCANVEHSYLKLP